MGMWYIVAWELATTIFLTQRHGGHRVRTVTIALCELRASVFQIVILGQQSVINVFDGGTQECRPDAVMLN